MNFDLSRQSLFATILFLTLLIVVFWGGQLSFDPLSVPAFTPLEREIDRWTVDNIFAARILTAALVFIVSLAITRLTIRNVIFLERTYMPALIYLIISSGYYCSVFSLRPLLATLILVWGITWIMRSYNRKGLASGDYVSAGFWFSMAALVFTPSAVVIPMLFVGLVMFRFWDIREWISAIAGLLMPMAASIAVFFIMDGDMSSAIENFKTHFHLNDSVIEPFRRVNVLQWTFIGTIAVIAILSTVTFLSHRKLYGNKAYLAYMYFVWFAILAICGGALTPLRTIYMLPLVALPLAVIMPSFFNARKATFLSNFLYAMFIITAIAISIFPLIVLSLK